MNQQALLDKLAATAGAVRADPRWPAEGDELGKQILGMLLYGLGLMAGRTLCFLDHDDIDAVVARVLVEVLGVEPAWAAGCVDAARRSAFDQSDHPAQHGLIGIGHSYLFAPEADVVANVFANIRSFRGGDRANG